MSKLAAAGLRRAVARGSGDPIGARLDVGRPTARALAVACSTAAVRLAGRSDRTACRAARADTGDRQSLDAVGDDPTVDDAQPTSRRRPVAVAHDRDRARSAKGRDDGVVIVDDERAPRVDELGEAALD